MSKKTSFFGDEFGKVSLGKWFVKPNFDFIFFLLSLLVNDYFNFSWSFWIIFWATARACALTVAWSTLTSAGLLLNWTSLFLLLKFNKSFFL
ncbi:hypothetical protein [Spiroplasma citri]|uniref:hypothetical protein n=1 Tax=Spiroplasma citri TaxID=2133 RepID=UPI001EE18570|nr:hypothetical protein [Spiroplasma citri]